MRRSIAISFATVASVACAHRAVPAAPEAFVRHGYAMGTPVRLTVPPQPGCDAAVATTAAFVEMQKLDVLLTTFTHPGWPPGDIMRLNERAGQGFVDIAADTLQVLELAQEVAQASDGAFDITFAALSALWHFDADIEPRVPASSLVAQARRRVNFRALHLRDAPPQACLQEPGMRVGLGGIGKGFAADRMAQILRARGCGDFLVQAGGELYAGGRHNRAPWEIGVTDPRAPAGAPLAVAQPRDAALSTSGDYERSFFWRGQRYHHILDPRTGMPASASRGVTVCAPQAALADALADAIFVLGAPQGLTLAARTPGVAAMLVDRAGVVHQAAHPEAQASCSFVRSTP